jgi:uncharacterized membrane protein/sporulation protein YlmC with PRC-barrel domain
MDQRSGDSAEKTITVKQESGRNKGSKKRRIPMIDIPLSAKVECVDGLCGVSTAVVVNPVTQDVTHFVVRDETSSSPVERLVPIDQIQDATQTLIRLRCTQAELVNMDPFTETHYILDEHRADYTHWSGGEVWQEPYATTEGAAYTAVEEQHVPPGELAVHRGTRVEASDGHIGEVGEFLIDPKSGHVTHLVLQEGHILGKVAVTLPLSTIDHVEEDTVYLKLSREAVESLPAIPIKRPSKRQAEGKNIELIARIYADPDQASEALEFVRGLHRRKVLKVLHTALVVKDEDGTVSLKETGDVDPKHGRLAGAITGGLIGLIGGPIGAVVGALAGAGVGGLAAKWIDLGFSDEFLKSFQEQVQPGSAAALIIVEDQWVTQASEALGDEEGMIFQQTLTDEMVQQLLESSEEETG